MSGGILDEARRRWTQEENAARKFDPSPESDLRPVVHDLAEFLRLELPPRENLLSPWLPAQGLAMVYAPRGIGKTFLSLGVAYAIASGGTFLNWEAPTPRGVLFLDGEMPAAVLQERLARIAMDADKEPVAPLRIVTPDLQRFGMPDLAGAAGQEFIEECLAPEIKLIVVDNISTLARGTKENEGDSWLPIQSWALHQRAKGRSVLFIHHAGKGGGQRGTSRREDVLDTVIALRRPADYDPGEGAKFEIHFEKARGIHGKDVEPFEAKLTTDAGGKQTWAVRNVADATFDRVVGLVNDGLMQKDIADELGINKSNVSRHIRRAKEAGLVEDVKDGRSTRAAGSHQRGGR